MLLRNVGKLLPDFMGITFQKTVQSCLDLKLPDFRIFGLTNPLSYHILDFSFPLALQPNSGLGRLHETFRFTSVTRSRTATRTPWTGDQLLARPLPVHKHRKTHTQHEH
jgi:hypothetical protein